MLTPSFVSSIEAPISTHKVFTPNYLAKHIQDCVSEQFTGRLDLNFKTPQDQHWSLYFCQGGLIWCTSQVHPIRRWCRQLFLHCPQLIVNNAASASPQLPAISQGSVWSSCLDYYSLAEQVRQRKIEQRQMAAVIEGNIIEIVFDIHQQWGGFGYSSELQLTYRMIPKNIISLINTTLILIRADQAWQQAIQGWEAWQQAALVDYSPNRAPVIWKAEELRRQTSPAVYSKLTQLMDGNQTLRDLSVKLKQNLLPLTQSIMPYIRQGLIGLIEVGDIKHSVKPVRTTTSLRSSSASSVQPQATGLSQATGPLVACIDDSRIDSEAMYQILSQAGYRCINIQNPVKALPILLEHKPVLIFLDLVMPVANGYEICAQIRRVSAFKDTPVIILTSNDGIVDRVRAKMIGSSGFLAKPIDSEKVLRILHRYLAPPMPVSLQRLPIAHE